MEVNRPTTLLRLPLGGWLPPTTRVLSGLAQRIDPSDSDAVVGLLLNRPAKLPRLPLFDGDCWLPPLVVSGLLLKISLIAPEILAGRQRLWCAEVCDVGAILEVHERIGVTGPAPTTVLR